MIAAPQSKSSSDQASYIFSVARRFIHHWFAGTNVAFKIAFVYGRSYLESTERVAERLNQMISSRSR